jgi:very-short-patch-repair endonuclease
MASRMTPIARRLRREQTSAEKALWERLRDRKVRGLKFRRQFPIVGRVADFACLEARLAVELDGVIHESPEAQEADDERATAIEAGGWRIIRFTNRQVIDDIERVILAISWEARCRGTGNRD